ncbi:MAG: SMP-30/gluconolactonase/LRE family protein [Acidimicrobiales bacterium]
MTTLEVRDQRLKAIVSDEPVVKRAGGFEFTEGPVWSPAGTLIFSDIPASTLYELDPAIDQVSCYRKPSHKANGNTYDHQGRLVTCEHATSRVVREEADGSLTVLAAEYAGAELNSPNDVVVDKAGRIWFTDPPYGRMDIPEGDPRPFSQPVQGVYRLDPGDGSITLVADDFDRPNGLCFADDERVLFVNDTSRMHVRSFEVRGANRSGGEAQLIGGEVWARLEGTGEGAPDGMKVDSEGNLYCCGPGGVHVFSREGHCLGVVLVPETVANFNWGDKDRKTLYMCAVTGLYSGRVLVPGPAGTVTTTAL